MPSVSLYARPGDDVSPNATWSMVVGSANAAYPVSNLGNRNPAKPFKSTGTTATMRATFGVSQVLVGVAVINHNLAGATSVKILSGTGLNQTITIPANGADGQCVNPFLDFSAAASVQRTSTTFDIEVTTGVLGNLAIGEVLLLTARRDLRWIWGLTMTPDYLIQGPGDTFGGSLLQYDKKIRQRSWVGRTQLQAVEAEMNTLHQQAKSAIFPWLLIEDRNVNECAYVQFVRGSYKRTPRSIGSTEIAIEVRESSSGPPLFA